MAIQGGGMARDVDAMPIVADAAARDALFPLGTRKQNQRIKRLDTGAEERWNGSKWVTDQGLPAGRQTTSIQQFLANNTKVRVDDWVLDTEAAINTGLVPADTAVARAVAWIQTQRGVAIGTTGNPKGYYLSFGPGTYNLTTSPGLFDGGGCIGIVGEGHDQTNINWASTTLTLDASTATNKTATAVSVTTGSATLSAVAGTAGSTYERAAGSFVTDGFVVGMYVASTGFGVNSTKNRVLAVSALQLTMEDALATDGAAAARTLTATNVLVDTNQTGWGTANSLVGKIVEIVSASTGAGQKRRIYAHNATGIVVAPWATALTGSVVYRIYEGPVCLDIGPQLANEIATPNLLVSRFTLSGFTITSSVSGTYSHTAIRVTATRNFTADDVYITFNSQTTDNTSTGFALFGHDESAVRGCNVTAALPFRLGKDTRFGFGYGYDHWNFTDLSIYTPTPSLQVDGFSALWEVDSHSNGLTSCKWQGNQTWVGGNGAFRMHGVNGGVLYSDFSAVGWETQVAPQTEPTFRLYGASVVTIAAAKLNGYSSSTILKLRASNLVQFVGLQLLPAAAVVPFDFDNSCNNITIDGMSSYDSVAPLIGGLLQLVETSGVFGTRGMAAHMRFSKYTPAVSTTYLYGRHQHAETVTVPASGSVTLNTPYLNVTYKILLRIDGDWPNGTAAEGYGVWRFSAEATTPGVLVGSADAALAGAASKIGITCAAGALPVLTNGYATPRVVHLVYTWGAGF